MTSSDNQMSISSAATHALIAAVAVFNIAVDNVFISVVVMALLAVMSR